MVHLETPTPVHLRAAGSAKRVLLLPGDGIGPEVIAAAQKVIDALELDVTYTTRLVGQAALSEFGRPFEADLVDVAREHDAILFGAVGGGDAAWSRWLQRPEQAIFTLRRELDLFANVRPVRSFDGGPRPHGRVDILIVRELTGGLYFGDKTWSDGIAVDVCRYSEHQVERVVRIAFAMAEQRRKRLTLIDKANVLVTSVLWRSVFDRVAREFPMVAVERLLADNAAMQLLLRPSSFDVIVTENLFGDLLSDEAAAIVGGLGLAPSASFGDTRTVLYEPCHGTAPDIAGTGTANPIAAILCVAMMLERSMRDPAGARAVEAAVAETIRGRIVTPDLGGTASTADVTDAVVAHLARAREERSVTV